MRRINRAVDKGPVIQSLSEGDNPVFKEKWRLLIFAAILGFKRDQKDPLGTTDQGAAIRSELFAKDPCFEGILNLMTLLLKGDSKLLTATDENDDQKIKLFEEYANGGLAILQDKLQTSSYSLESVISFLAQEIHENAAADIDLSEVRI